jgi:hypothetical protein
MGLAGVFTNPGDRQSLAKWSFNHMMQHRDIIRAIKEQQQIILPEFILDPFDPDNLGIWQYQHQLMHSDFDSLLGIAGNNLIGIDFNDPAIRTSWLFLHGPEHREANGKLGL